MPSIHFTFNKSFVTSRCWCWVALATLAMVTVTGCETDSFFDPSRVGYFERVPTTIPVLTRLDTIEQIPDPLGRTGPPEQSDLAVLPIQYTLGEGDVVKTEIFELVSINQTETAVRSIDQSGDIRLPVLGDIHAAGLTVAQFEEAVVARAKRYIPTPLVNVSVEEGRTFIYSIGGAVEQPGEFKLARPDFRLRNALVISGGAAPTTERVLVVRGATSLDTSGDGSDAAAPSTSGGGAVDSTPGGNGQSGATTEKPVSIDDLINEIQESPPAGQSGEVSPQPAQPEMAPGVSPPPPLEPEPPAEVPTENPRAAATSGSAPVVPGIVRSPRQSGLVQSGSAVPIDIDTLEPVSVTDQSAILQGGTSRALPESRIADDGDGFIFDLNKQEWVKLKASGGLSSQPQPQPVIESATQETRAPAPRVLSKPLLDLAAAMALGTRIIEIDYLRLMAGDASQNVVIRNGDWVFVEPDIVGNIYIGGEISRPGVFTFPPTGLVSLSRMVDAAGGLGQLAIPERVDLVRRVGADREACIRVNLSAIRNRAEPDIALKPDDHIIIGTNFWASPLAVFRNGFRMTYGFGFLLDRNWGNDVFGAPPSNYVGG